MTTRAQRTWDYVNRNSRQRVVGAHGEDGQSASGPALATDEAKAETPKGVSRSGPSGGITGHQSSPFFRENDRTLMAAENRVHRLFLQFIETTDADYRNDFFHAMNADDWVCAFGEWLVKQQAESASVRASND